MRTLLVTDSALAATLVSHARAPGDEDLVVLSTNPALTRKLRRRGLEVVTGSLTAAATWKRAELDEDTVVLVALEKAADVDAALAQVAAVGSDVPVLVLDMAEAGDAEDEAEDERPRDRNVERVLLADMVRAPFQQVFANARVRRRVHEWRDHFRDADRILILLHDEPDPDALASAICLRALLGRNRQTAIIGTFKAPTRPENVRMVELLGVDVTELTEPDLAGFQRIAVVDTQPHIFAGKVTHVDLVIDHHPPRTGYTATYKDIRTHYGATTSMLLDYLIRFGIPISERIATAATYAIKTDTWTFRRGAVAEDVALFAHVYPRADQALLRRIENEGFTLETLENIGEMSRRVERAGSFIFVHAGDVPREDIVPTMADFLLNLAEARWTACSGVIADALTVSVRNMGYQRSAGELVQQVYGDLGAAGGHRAAARVIVPLDKLRERFGDPSAKGFARRFFEPLWQAAGEVEAEAEPEEEEEA